MKQMSKKQLESIVQALAWNERFGCYTRAGLEQLVWPQIAGSTQAVIFIDVDDMHDLNVKHGYEGVNDIIRKSLVLRESDIKVGQWYSGDEFAIFITENGEREAADPQRLCERLREAFAKNGASATFGYTSKISSDLNETVKPAFEIVQNAKREGRRGTINGVL